MQMRAKEVLEKLSGFPIRTFQRGETVLQAGSVTGHLLFLQQGAVDVVLEEARLTRVTEPGSVFGDMSFLLCRPHTADVLAAQPSRFQVVADPAAFLEAEPRVALHLSTVLAQRLNAVNHLLSEARKRAQDTGQPAGLLAETLNRVGRAGSVRRFG